MTKMMAATAQRWMVRYSYDGGAGSGTRTSYFVSGRGLVKLVFRHKDRSTSVVELLR